MGLYITNGKNIKQYRYGDGIGSGIITDVFIDEKNNYWIGTTSGLVLFDGQTFQNFGSNDGLGGGSFIRKVKSLPKAS